ncbi:hypothetical protein [Streptomyces sp. NBC_00239]|uniref:hypothetical protein n=1 Tax=Streptomyces sp. NBC_00239 TaxID=2903640 RepID=UPI002E2DFA10|nr:hypothetical protein [Streptomyces sp. NBC_00239]
MTRRRFLAAGAGATAALTGATALTGCGTGDGPRPVTPEEAQQLALVRLSAYEHSPAALRVRIPGPAGTTTVDGVLDYRTRRASGTYAVPGGAGSPGARGELAWDDRTVSVNPAGGSPRWSGRAYTRAPLDRALLLTLQLGHDRPENAQLLAQNGAVRLGRRQLDGVDCTVFGGPRPPRRDRAAAPASPLSYWVDAGGGLRRVEARLDPQGPPVTVDFRGRAPAAGGGVAAGAGHPAPAVGPQRPAGSR